MKISSNSWHYRIAERFLSVPYRRVSLCKYFWIVVGSGAIHVLLGMIGIALLWCAFVFVASLVGFWWYLYARSVWELPPHILMIAILDMMAAFVVGLLIWEHKRPGAVGKRLSRLVSRTVSGAKESLLGQYIKAVIDKVCPILEIDYDPDAQ